MVTAYYITVFLLSLALMIAYMFVWQKHFDTLITIIFVLVPVTNLAYPLLAISQTQEAALMANRLTYIGGCYLLPILMLAVCSLCHIKVRRWVRVLILVVSTIVYLSSLTIGISPIFYESVTFARVDGVPVFEKQYGFMHTVFIVMVIAYFVMSISAIAYSYFKNNQVSRKTIYLLFATELIAMVCFFGGRALFSQVELLPAAYTFALALYLVIAYRINLYDITDSAIDSLVQTGDTGFASFDFNCNYLGSNETAKEVFPELRNLTVDLPISDNETMRETVLAWIQAFAADETHSEIHFERNDRIYLVTITYLFTAKRKKGYQLFITDDTERQRYVKLLGQFNTELQNEVEAKTARIVDMHDNLILSMATMVESRDNSTGGHIRRTSEGVRLIIAEMKKDDANGLSDEFCNDVIKAAPMHDLGKIAVDDAILRKPGRFTPEEFEKMKAHAAEGARIVHDILAGTDDESFKVIAENVAHYHHERWDGSGYPQGLSGQDIPLEARIMAIADVYDALVSKRVYKEAMSFERANSIIMEGMGSQFDEGLKPYYESARPNLESYYAHQEA